MLHPRWKFEHVLTNGTPRDESWQIRVITSQPLIRFLHWPFLPGQYVVFGQDAAAPYEDITEITIGVSVPSHRELEIAIVDGCTIIFLSSTTFSSMETLHVLRLTAHSNYPIVAVQLRSTLEDGDGATDSDGSATNA